MRDRRLSRPTDPVPARRHRRLLVDCLTLGAAVGLVGISFGVLARAAGLSVAKTCATSLLVFTGASQLAAVAVVASGGSAAAVLGGALLLGARNGLYSVAVRPLLPRSWWRRLVAAQLTIDESAGMALAQPDRERSAYAFWATGFAVYVFWNAGTLLGALAGDVLGSAERLGLDAAFPAAFLALLVPMVRDAPARRVAVLAAVVALVAVPFTPAGVPVLLAALAVGAGLR